jgi:hypothetical protein
MVISTMAESFDIVGFVDIGPLSDITKRVRGGIKTITDELQAEAKVLGKQYVDLARKEFFSNKARNKFGSRTGTMRKSLDFLVVLDKFQKPELEIGFFKAGAGIDRLNQIYEAHQNGTTIRPKNAKHLVVPVDKGLRASGSSKYFLRQQPTAPYSNISPYPGELFFIPVRNHPKIKFRAVDKDRLKKESRKKRENRRTLPTIFLLMSEVKLKKRDPLEAVSNRFRPTFVNGMRKAATRAVNRIRG